MSPNEEEYRSLTPDSGHYFPALNSPMSRSRLSPSRKPKPQTKHVRDLNGTWKLSKPLSAGVPPALAIQGFSSIARQAIIASPIKLHISQSNYPSQLFVKQTTSANLPPSTERWYPPQKSSQWSEWVHNGCLTRSRCRWISSDAIEQRGIAFLSEGMGSIAECIEAEVECEEHGWKAVQVWFVERGGKLVRRVVTFGKDGKRAETRWVYELEV